ncbi:MAG: deoxyguanosinetriphosphate triphosphohydrolase [Candidatus Aureabacteria bacterium]|nr:deoxyguanosinetriphosphate triphosphohydrolase [Candidatus Auribacterota bacterium]
MIQSRHNLSQPLFTHQEYEDFLSPYAQRSADSKGRRYREMPHPFRNPYQRDRDRIIHCRAFRRLEHKAQVLVYQPGDHYRTRLTHTLEVSQIARSMARTLRIHEDLVEAIALAHDLGHSPFGHAGENILHQLMNNEGGFEHNLHSLRIVDYLENSYPQFRGLNLTYEVRHGLVKHRKSEAIPSWVLEEYDVDCMPILEAQIVDLSDEIAYVCHDLEDGLTYGYLHFEDVSSFDLLLRAEPSFIRIKDKPSKKVLIYHQIRALIDLLVRDAVETTIKELSIHSIRSIHDVVSRGSPLVILSKDLRQEFDEFRQYLYDHFYKHEKLEERIKEAEQVIQGLFVYFVKHPNQLPKNFRNETRTQPVRRVICDYIAGMTDRYAIEEHRRRGL